MKKVFELLAQAEQHADMTLRDDQAEFSVFLDAAKICRRNAGRFRLIDTGKFSLFELEWLGEAGADLYTSDGARPNAVELGLLAKAAAKGRAIVAYFHHGLPRNESGGEPDAQELLPTISRSGVYVHLSNRDRQHDPADLAPFADICRKAGARFIYYHHGRPAAGLAGISRDGGWVHVSDQDLGAGDDIDVLVEAAQSAASSGAGVVLHVERGSDHQAVRDLLKAGGYVLFQTPPSDYRSPFRSLERQARKRRLDLRAVYLTSTFMP